ncbi:MAG: four helix bundle protein [bacterium]|nr:four helix bundle protein [bacterium]
MNTYTNSKLQTTNYKQIQMSEITNSKQYDLEERTARFAELCRDFIKKLPRTAANFEYGKQLIRSSGSQAANYIEANEALGKKDFTMRIKICRKETKESCLWLRLCEVGEGGKLEEERARLIKEAMELRNIFTAILNKSN